MTQTIHPLYGSPINDSEVARSVGLPGGVYEGMEPVCAGAGGGAGWTVTMGVDTRSGRSLWRTAGDVPHGRFIIEEDAAVQVHIDAPDATHPRIDLVVGVHKWVEGPVDTVTLEPTGGITVAQRPTYVVVKGTPSASPADPTVPDPYDVDGKRAVVLARVTVPVTGPAFAERHAATDLRLDYMRSVLAEVESARNAYPTLGNRIDAIGSAQLIEAVGFTASVPGTGGGSYQPIAFSTTRKYGDAVSLRSATTLGLTKPGLYEILGIFNSTVGAAHTAINGFRLTLAHDGGAETVIDNVPDGPTDDENQTVYAMVYVDPSWTNTYITFHHDSNYGGAARGSAKFLGASDTLGALAISTGNQILTAGPSQTWPDFAQITLGTTNEVGAVTWAVIPGAGLQDGTTDPKATIVGGNKLQIDWTADPGTLPVVWSIKLRATDSASPARIVDRTITVTMNAYSAVALAITTGDKTFAMVGSEPFEPSFLGTAVGGTTPYTWALVAGVDTTLPGAAINAGTGVVTSSLTMAEMNAGPYKVRLRCTDSAGSPVQVEKVINITTSASSGSGGWGGGGGHIETPTV